MNYLLRTNVGSNRRPNLFFYIYLLFNSDIVSYVLRTNAGRDRRLGLLFCSLECFNYRWVGGCYVKHKFLFMAD